MQEFYFKVIDKLGEANVVVDFLLRLHVPDVPIAIDDRFPNEHLFSIINHNPWYADIENYLAIGSTPPHFSPKECKILVEKSFNFSWIARFMFYTGPDQVTRRCVHKYETSDILHACHDEPCGGHFIAKRKTFKILTSGYYWPTLHKDAAKYTRHCDRCQRMGCPTKLDEMPL